MSLRRQQTFWEEMEEKKAPLEATPAKRPRMAPLEEKKAPIEEKKAPLEEMKAPLEEKKAPLEEKKAPLEETPDEVFSHGSLSQETLRMGGGADEGDSSSSEETNHYQDFVGPHQSTSQCTHVAQPLRDHGFSTDRVAKKSSGAELADSGVYLEPADSGVQPANSGAELAEPASSGAEPADSGVQPADSGVQNRSAC